MKQSIFRIQKDSGNPYVMVNKQFLNNVELSWKAKGLLTYLLSLPDNWQVYEDEIVKHSKDGKDSLRSAIKELIANDYIQRERIRNASGQLKGYNYCVYELPNHIGKSKDGKTDFGESDTTNNNVTNINRSETETLGSLSDDETSAISFLEFKRRYRLDNDAKRSIDYYLLKYKRHMKRDHPELTVEQWSKVVNSWFLIDRETYEEEVDITSIVMNEIIDIHFETKYKRGNYSIMHFLSSDIRTNRFHEWQRSSETEEC